MNKSTRPKPRAGTRSPRMTPSEQLVLEALGAGVDLPTILAMLCRSIEERGAGMLCSVLLLDPDRTHLHVGAAPSLPPAFNAAVEGLPVGPAAGSCGTAVYRREPVVVTDIATDPLWAAYVDQTLPHGLRACWSTPIFGTLGDVLGTFALYFRRPRSPTAAQQDLVTHAVHLARVTIEGSTAQEALRRSEANLRLLMEQAADGIILAERDGRLVEANPAVCRLLGYTRSELLRLRIRDTYPEGENPVSDGMTEDLERGQTIRYERSARRKDGSIIPVEVIVNRRTDGRLQGILRDITERRRADRLHHAVYRISEAAHTARSLQELYRSIHEIVGELMPARNFYIALYDATTGIMRFPYFLDEFDSPPASRRLDKSLTGYLVRTGEPLLATPEVWADLERRGEVELVGSPSVDWVGVPLKAEGRCIGALVIQSYTPGQRYGEAEREILQFVSTQVAMVVQRKQAEEALRDVNQNLQALIQAAPLAIFTLDKAGCVRSWNPAATHLFGWGAADVMGQPIPFVAPESPQYCEVRERIARGEAVTGAPVTCQPRKGGAVEISLSAAPLYDASGDISGLLGIAADVSELRLLENQFRQSQKMEAIGRLAGGVAHDFNNILTAILTTTELLLLDASSESEARADLGEIRTAAQRAAALTRQLLAFSRQQVMQPQVLDINALVTNLEAMLQRLIGEDVALHTLLSPDVFSVRADASQLEQVIMNLVVNARDAMPRGGILTLRTANCDLSEAITGEMTTVAPGRYVQLTVRDTGMGMTAETKAHIFEPFFTTKPAGEGTGLGLATVYGIVEQSGGHVGVSSAPGAGTAFDIYLPRVDSAPLGPPRDSGATLAVPGSGSETILLVEDEEMVRHVSERILRNAGYRVLEAAHGAEALRLMESHTDPIHLLVTDVVMPGMSGRELAEEAVARRPGLRVLYLSGYTDDAILRHGIQEPAMAFLQKPFSVTDLARKVRDTLDR